MDEKKYSSGEIAAAAGLTLRAVQHYDNIGLLPSSGRTEGGRRYYTQEDLIRLEQIVFYKSLNFSLEQIKGQLLIAPNTGELLAMFKRQQMLLLQKIEQLHTSFAMIDVISKIVEAGGWPPFHLLLQFLSALPGDDIFSQIPSILTAEQQEALSPYFQDFEAVRTFYHRWKELSIEAAVLLHAGIPPGEPIAQSVAERWWHMILSITSGDPALMTVLSNLHMEGQIARNNKLLLDSTDQYMQEAFAIYSKNNNLELL